MNLKISNKDEEVKAQRHTQVTQGQVSGSEGSLKILKTPKPLLFSPCHTNRREGGGDVTRLLSRRFDLQRRATCGGCSPESELLDEVNTFDLPGEKCCLPPVEVATHQGAIPDRACAVFSSSLLPAAELPVRPDQGKSASQPLIRQRQLPQSS